MTELRASAAVEIAAPIGRVWQVMTDLSVYGAWNPFVVAAAGPLEIGGELALTVRWSDGTGLQTRVRITEVSAPEGGVARLTHDSVGWIPALGMVRARRIQELTALPDGRTRYRSVESFSGWAAGWVPLARVQDGFERQAAALRERVELRG